MSLKDELKDNTSGLDERDQYFLDILFDEEAGDFASAMKRCGYDKKETIGSLRRRLSKEISKASKDYIVSKTPTAAIKLVSVLNDPSGLGAKNIISASKEILDRGDVNKSESVALDQVDYIVILPPKKTED